MKVVNWFGARVGLPFYNDDVLVNNEWYQYYRECARKLRLILRIIDRTGIAKDDSLMNTVIGESHRDMRKLADILDPEETKELFTHRKKEVLTSKPKHQQTKAWSKRRKDLYSWSKRAKQVGIPLLPPHRPSRSQRLAWEESIVKAESVSKPKKGKNPPYNSVKDGAYKWECIEKLKSLQVNDSLRIEDRIYQTVNWWVIGMENTMKDFEDKKFVVKEIDHNTQIIWRAK